MYNKNKKMILKNLCADIQEKERIARIMNSNSSLYDDFQNQMPFQSQELFSEEERQIVCHMCLRLGDQLESNKGDFIRLRFYRFICMILEDMESLQGTLYQISKNSIYNSNTRLIANGYKKILSDQVHQLAFISRNEPNTTLAQKNKEKNRFQYDVPLAFLTVLGIARLSNQQINFKKYEAVMPELMELINDK
ncbi:hypothetical protein [Lysinibacillus fusiformis]|uniref:hypothetical protein n=1 Tax=Lysinibacillus fusiformis TaxID=28031 RepID=UPI0037191039